MSQYYHSSSNSIAEDSLPRRNSMKRISKNLPTSVGVFLLSSATPRLQKPESMIMNRSILTYQDMSSAQKQTAELAEQVIASGSEQAIIEQYGDEVPLLTQENLQEDLRSQTINSGRLKDLVNKKSLILHVNGTATEAVLPVAAAAPQSAWPGADPGSYAFVNSSRTVAGQLSYAETIGACLSADEKVVTELKLIAIERSPNLKCDLVRQCHLSYTTEDRLFFFQSAAQDLDVEEDRASCLACFATRLTSRRISRSFFTVLQAKQIASVHVAETDDTKYHTQFDCLAKCCPECCLADCCNCCQAKYGVLTTRKSAKEAVITLDQFSYKGRKTVINTQRQSHALVITYLNLGTQNMEEVTCYLAPGEPIGPMYKFCADVSKNIQLENLWLSTHRPVGDSWRNGLFAIGAAGGVLGGGGGSAAAAAATTDGGGGGWFDSPGESLASTVSIITSCGLC